MMDLMAGDLMDDPVDGERAVLGMRERRRAVGRGQGREQGRIHPRQRDEYVERLAAAVCGLTLHPEVLIEVLCGVVRRAERHPGACAEGELGLREVRQD